MYYVINLLPEYDEIIYIDKGFCNAWGKFEIHVCYIFEIYYEYLIWRFLIHKLRLFVFIQKWVHFQVITEVKTGDCLSLPSKKKNVESLIRPEMLAAADLLGYDSDSLAAILTCSKSYYRLWSISVGDIN